MEYVSELVFEAEDKRIFIENRLLLAMNTSTMNPTTQRRIEKVYAVMCQRFSITEDQLKEIHTQIQEALDDEECHTSATQLKRLKSLDQKFEPILKKNLMNTTLLYQSKDLFKKLPLDKLKIIAQKVFAKKGAEFTHESLMDFNEDLQNQNKISILKLNSAVGELEREQKMRQIVERVKKLRDAHLPGRLTWGRRSAYKKLLKEIAELFHH